MNTNKSHKTNHAFLSGTFSASTFVDCKVDKSIMLVLLQTNASFCFLQPLEKSFEETKDIGLHGDASLPIDKAFLAS